MKGTHESSYVIVAFWAFVVVLVMYSWLALASYMWEIWERFFEREEKKRKRDSEVYDRLHKEEEKTTKEK